MAIVNKPSSTSSPSNSSSPSPLRSPAGVVVATPSPTSRKKTAAPAPPKASKPKVAKTPKPAFKPKALGKPKATDDAWKPTRIPKGFRLVIDTSEQRPLFVVRQLDLPVANYSLTVGDYAIEGYEHVACVERKMLSDFDAFIGRERETKTIPKLEAMSKMVWSALVVECSPKKLYGKRKYGKMTKEHVRGFLKMASVKYGIHVFVSDDREEIERYVVDHLAYVYEGIVGTNGGNR